MDAYGGELDPPNDVRDLPPPLYLHLTSAQPIPLSINDILELQAMISTYTAPVMAYLHTDPSARDARAIPGLFAVLEEILDVLQRLQWSIPIPAYRDLILFVGEARDVLEAIEKDTNRFRGLAPLAPGFSYEIGDYGRPRVAIDEETLLLLMEEGYKDRDLQDYLGPRQTLWRRRKELGITKRNLTDLDDLDLSVAIERVRSMGTRQEGEIGVLAGLKSLDIVIPRARVWSHLRRMYPGEITHRWSKNLKRRTYSVAFYNSLWHIDGHHKLIRWKLVIHGGIDGFSRTITFLHASSNNQADTVTRLFWEGVQRHGCPSRVRADFGGENLGVKQLMEEHRGLGRGSFIQGTSTHNQRIERLWVDLQKWCTDSYRLVFEYLEENGMLNIENPVELWCLHFCYIPMLNHSLVWFTNRWNKHKMRTEGGRSPEQIAFQGCMTALSRGVDLRHNPMASPDALFDMPDPALVDFSEYSTDNLGARANIPPQADDPYVVINPVLETADTTVAEFLLQESFLNDLEAIAGPAWPPGDDFGTERYHQVCEVVCSQLEIHFPQLFQYE
ncbi:hypothetical protein P7C73_g1822, partial [Tremellales sp. Uapishka_1]